jgi:phage recombination protein Bet
MSKEIALVNFNEDQINLIKSQIAKDCNNNELELFLYQCKQTGLNPLTRQIYAIKRAGRMTIQTSIDGFRVIAERSGNYAGQDEPLWEDDEKGFPIKCTVKVYKFTPNFEQRYCAGVGVAHFKEYYPSPMNLQKTMPHAMIAKVAEALALRKAFPQDLSGLYTSDEMNQADEIKIVNETQSPLDNPTVLEGMGVKRNASGLKVGTDLTDGSAMKEVFDKQDEVFDLIKLHITNRGSIAELEAACAEKRADVDGLNKTLQAKIKKVKAAEIARINGEESEPEIYEMVGSGNLEK